MKRLVVYYSLEGHTHFVARQTAELLGCDLYELVPQKQYPSKGFLKFLLAGIDASFHRLRALKEPLVDVKPYDLVVLATPVWAGQPSSPMYTFLKSVSLKGKTLHLMACSSGGDASKCLQTMQKLCKESRIGASISFVDPDNATFAPDEIRLKAFCSDLLNREASDAR